MTSNSGQEHQILQIALLQMGGAGFDQDANLKKADAFCREAAAQGADIALFPEMFNIAYTAFAGESQDAVREWQGRAVPHDSRYVRYFGALAKELNMAIAATYLEAWNGAPRNAVTLFDRHGEQRFTYAKVHTCDFGKMEASLTPGDGFFVTSLDTRLGPINTGAMICYDREFPESARLLMLQGAEIILTPNACELESNRLCQFKARAWENSVGVFMTNYPAPANNGHSVAYGPEGEELALADDQERLVMAELDLTRLREYRKTSYWGNAYRRPHRYGKLLDMAVEAPFERANAFGQPFVREER